MPSDYKQGVIDGLTKALDLANKRAAFYGELQSNTIDPLHPAYGLMHDACLIVAHAIEGALQQEQDDAS